MRNKYLKILISLFACCLLPAAYSFAQPVNSPDVKCLNVAANGTVTLTWVIPSDPAGSFVDYKIFSSILPYSGYALIGTVTTYTQNFYNDAAANANANRIYYIVQTEYKNPSGISAPADTFSTVFLKVTDPLSSGNAFLTWNKISFHGPPSPKYKIHREYPVNNWILYDSTAVLSYNDKFHVCNDTVSYRIESTDNTGCPSFSNVAGKTLKDKSLPIITPIDTVSVNGTGLATISWSPSPSPDADSVIIYRSTAAGGPWFPIAAVPVPQTSYTYAASLAGTMTEFYRIAFKDSCFNTSAQGIYHQTIYLSASFDACKGTADLTWNNYINMSPPAPQYEVLVSVNGGAFNVIAITSSTAYTDTGLVIGTAYCYILRASNGIKTSSSNKTCFTPNIVMPPAFTYNRFATVQSDQSILITGHVDPAPSVTNYFIERAVAPGGIFSVVATMPTSSVTVNSITYTDTHVNTQTKSYSYKWEAMNSCNKVIMSSNIGTTILLKASVAINLNMDLSWSNYGDWLGKVDHYEVYQAVDGVWNPSPVYSGTGNAYIDDVSPFFATSRGIFYYKVVAIEGNGDSLGFTDSSTSNLAKVYEYPKIYVPNTFTPNGDGLNDIFKPVIGFIEPGEYSLRIYDNYGYPIMESTNPAEGWDGKMKGHRCQEGVYMYVINCTASNGDNSRVSGTISLIR